MSALTRDIYYVDLTSSASDSHGERVPARWKVACGLDPKLNPSNPPGLVRYLTDIPTYITCPSCLRFLS